MIKFTLALRKLVFFSLLILLITVGCTTSSISKPFDQQSIETKGLKLSITSQDFDTIVQYRSIAIKDQYINKSLKKYFKGWLICGNDSLRVKARLKGDHTDHLAGSRWSFRLKLKTGKVWGHRKFSVHAVHTRRFLNEWVFHKLLKEEGLVYLDYTFLPFAVNDTLNGIYAYESHFTSEILNKAKRPLGPMLGFDEEEYFTTGSMKFKPQIALELIRRSNIKNYHKKWSKLSGENQKETKLARQLIDSLRNGLVKPEQVLDVALWAKYIAVTELMGFNHNFHWHNLKFYYNPSTGKLEPIGCDNMSSFDISYVWSLEKKGDPLVRYILSSEVLMEQVSKELCRVSRKEYWEAFFSQYEDEVRKYEAIIKKENPAYKFEPEAFYYSGLRIQKGVKKHGIGCP